MKVTFFQDQAGTFVNNHPDLMIKLGNKEIVKLHDELANLKLISPIYVTGLARSGTTILLEKLAEQNDLVSFRYKDFPFVHIPIWWENFLKRAGSSSGEKVERAHKDRIKITPNSPEAIEEILWMSFYKDIHNIAENNLLDQQNINDNFIDFYKNTIKKVLLSRGGNRYLAKNNYTVSRIKMLKNIFPDGKFVIAVRNPTDTIASLIKQHKLFCDVEKIDKKVLRYMQNLGHFEFGLDRRPINFGDTKKTMEIQKLLDDENILGYAKYWAVIYSYVIKLIKDSSVNRNIILIDYDTFCANPSTTLKKIYKHCELDIKESKLIEQANTISAPTYYKHGFTEQELNIIEKETRSVQDQLKSLIN